MIMPTQGHAELDQRYKSKEYKYGKIITLFWVDQFSDSVILFQITQYSV